MEVEKKQLKPPEKLNSSHELENFYSGNSNLDNWLKQCALKNQSEGASRTYVLCSDNAIVAYYCLANGAIAQTVATGLVRHHMPDLIPVMIVGRLAVDRSWQGKGIGRALLRDAILRTLQAAEIAGIQAIIVQAISEDAKQFYQQCGFAASPLDPMILMVKIADAIATLG